MGSPRTQSKALQLAACTLLKLTPDHVSWMCLPLITLYLPVIGHEIEKYDDDFHVTMVTLMVITITTLHCHTICSSRSIHNGMWLL